MQGEAAPLCVTVIFRSSSMNSARLKRLQAAGWKVGSARDFLKLSDEEAMLVELKLSLTDALKQARRKRHLSQIDLAQRMGSSQSRVAKIEAGDPSVSFDLIVRAFLATGATRQELQRAFSMKEHR
jgi:ribosome-binding protein aMBF1 (putative translation factor)